MLKSFWAWYERTYVLNISIALFLFGLQIVHLLWLSGEVVWLRLFGAELFSLSGWWQNVIVLVDYTEIPALISVSLVYLNELRKVFSWKNVMYLFFLNIQLVHIFWITDEFVVTAFNEAGTVLPYALAWVAIGIDYLELPVIVDTASRTYRAWTSDGGAVAIKEALSEE